MDTALNLLAKDLIDGSLSLFVGAGLSMDCGLPNWTALIEEATDALELSDHKEYIHPVKVAQWYINETDRNRINQIIRGKISSEMTPSENHRIISQLPLNSVWTTNYDKLIERAFTDNNKIIDIKTKESDFTFSPGRRDCTLFKMHGDIDNLDTIVISKEDYDLYYKTGDYFLRQLMQELITTTFLFLGFSFADPNLDSVLSKIYASHKEKIKDGKSQLRTHYFVIRRPAPDSPNSILKKYKLEKNELEKLNLKAIEIDSYEDITTILRKLRNSLLRNRVFVSGSAHSYGKYEVNSANKLIFDLSKEMIKCKCTIVNGFGLGVGSSIINGALTQIYSNTKIYSENQLVLKPFPQIPPPDRSLKVLWSEYRMRMIAETGVTVILFGNKKRPFETNNNQGNESDDQKDYLLADGIREEYAFSVQNRNIIIPYAKTGFIAEELAPMAIEHNTQLLSSNIGLLRLSTSTINAASDEEFISNLVAFLKAYPKSF